MKDDQLRSFLLKCMCSQRTCLLSEQEKYTKQKFQTNFGAIFFITLPRLFPKIRSADH